MRIASATDLVLAEAVEILRAGRLVVMPTETVYGLAGAIDKPEAIQQIFTVKKRPANNPLIVHIAARSQLAKLTSEVTSEAELLMEAFWPGPLTVVFRKTDRVSHEVTAGGSTVAVRMPAHPVARELIIQSGCELAAPSANVFMHLSPTRAEDVSSEIGDQVEIVIDGGPCEIGLESTVVDCSRPEITILRLGQLGKSAIESVVGEVVVEMKDSIKSPGQHPRHYSPKTKTRIVDGLAQHESGLTFRPPTNMRQIQMPSHPKEYGARLYAALNQIDRLGLSEILIEAPPRGEEWQAIWDRIQRATTPM